MSTVKSIPGNRVHFTRKSNCSNENPVKISRNPFVLEKISYALKGSEMLLGVRAASFREAEGRIDLVSDDIVLQMKF